MIRRLLPALPWILLLGCSHDWSSGNDTSSEPDPASAAGDASAATDAATSDAASTTSDATLDATADSDGMMPSRDAAHTSTEGVDSGQDDAATASTSTDASSSGDAAVPAPRAMCPAPLAPTSGFVTAPQPALSGDSASFTCDGGRVPVGASKATCGNDGRWSAEPPRCEFVGCETPAALTHGSFSVQGNGASGYTVSYRCDAGYQLSGLGTGSCEADGKWSAGARSCVPLDCGPQSAPADGKVDTSAGTTFGASVLFSCNTGYKLSGDASRRCGETGSWSGERPQCVPVDCGAPSAPPHGSVLAPQTSYDKLASFSCESGYVLRGNASQRCGMSGAWEGAAPTCAAVDCQAPGTPLNGKSSAPDGTTFGARASFRCNDNYYLLGNAERTCLSSGTWSGSLPRCGKVLFRDDFEDGSFTDSWVLDAGKFALSTATAANGSNTSLVMQGASGNSHLGVHTLLPTGSRPTYISWWTRVESVEYILGYFTACPDAVHCASGGAAIWAFFNNGNEGGYFFPGRAAFEPGKWYHLELRDIDWATRTAKLYFNGAQIYSATLPGSGGITRLDMYNFEWMTPVPETALAYWDEVLVVE